MFRATWFCFREFNVGAVRNFFSASFLKDYVSFQKGTLPRHNVMFLCDWLSLASWKRSKSMVSAVLSVPGMGEIAQEVANIKADGAEVDQAELKVGWSNKVPKMRTTNHFCCLIDQIKERCHAIWYHGSGELTSSTSPEKMPFSRVHSKLTFLGDLSENACHLTSSKMNILSFRWLRCPIFCNFDFPPNLWD